MKRGAPRIDLDDDELQRFWDAVVPIALPGQYADGSSTHPHPRWGGRRPGSGRKPSQAPSAAQFVKLGYALTPRHLALLEVHQMQFEIASRSASLRTILDDYIAGVPGLAEILDQIAGGHDD